MGHDIGQFQNHSDRYLSMALRTDRHHVLEQPDGVGSQSGDCRDNITFYLRIAEDRITQGAFVTHGCINTAACANALIELTEGRPVDHAWSISPAQVIAFLETLPEDHFHCADRAVAAFRAALADWRRSLGSSWKRPYR